MNLDLTSILSILASLTSIFSPFILNFLSPKDNVGNSFNASRDINFNLELGVTKGTRSDSHKRLYDEIISNLCSYIERRYVNFKFNIRIIIFITVLLTTFNFLLVSFSSSDFFIFDYIKSIIDNSFSNRFFGYLTIIITLSTAYFYIMYFTLLYLYERDLERVIRNQFQAEDKGRLIKLKTKISKKIIIKKNDDYPFKIIIRIIENIDRDRKNRIKISRGNHKPLIKKINFLSQHNVLKPLIIILIVNVLFYVVFSDSGERYLAKISTNSLTFTNGDILKDDEEFKVFSSIIRSGEGVVNFKILRSNGKEYLVDFMSIKIVEPQERFVRSGEAIVKTHLRFTPHGYEGMDDNSNKPVLSQGEKVRVHYFTHSDWVLVRTHDGRQGFVYKDNLLVYVN